MELMTKGNSEKSEKWNNGIVLGNHSQIILSSAPSFSYISSLAAASVGTTHENQEAR